MNFGRMGASFGRAAALRKAGRGDFPYPSFPYTTLAKFQTTADVQSSFCCSAIADVAVSGSPYPGGTMIQGTFNGGTSTFVPKAFLSSPISIGPYDSIRWTWAPMSGWHGLGSPTAFGIALFSSGSPSALPSNYHLVFNASLIKAMSTSVSTGVAGRPQSASFPISQAVAVGGGANLNNVIGAALIGTRGSNGTIAAIGNIDHVPNPRTKGAVIISDDDTYVGQYSQGYLNIFKPNGIPVEFAPAPSLTTIGTNPASWYDWAAIADMKAGGGQWIGKSFSTESAATVDGWSSAQRTQEYANARNYPAVGGGLNIRRDTYDGDYYSNVGPADMTAYPELSAAYRTLRNFKNMQTSNNPPWPGYSETFPPGDPKQIICCNNNTFGDGSTTLDQYLTYALDYTRNCRGILMIGFHNDFGNSNIVNMINNTLIPYVKTTYPDQMEFTTRRKLFAPHNGDTLLG